MKVPLRLRRVRPQPAAALYLAGDADALLALCARVGGPELPPVFAVAGGFVVRLRGAAEGPWLGAVRLQALADNLLVPADAELTPELLPDEAAALTRQRGLLLLPGGRVLAFDPTAPLTATDLIAAPPLTRGDWRPLPERPGRPGELVELLLEGDDPSAEAIIDRGGDGIGEEAPRPPGAGVLGTAAGRSLAGLGQALGWLGDKLHWAQLARLGAGLVKRGLEQAPRVSESLLGRQEAALRELLRQFREGRTDEALRRALPIGGPSSRGSALAGGAALPFHNLFYRLADLLGGDRGPAGVWVGNVDVQAELIQEYRKAAEEATRRGDHRRAAFIYGRLLFDWRQAAAALARGGLHHDAAAVYLEKLGDHLAAAQQLEQAGEVDRALELYRQRGEHVLAGDLLRRAGEPDRAVEEYLVAARQEAARDNHLAAAELMLGRAARADLAEPFLLAGWKRRPQGTALSCLLRLAELYAERPTHEALLGLVDEADAYFTRSAAEPQVGRFYNELARLAEREGLASLRDDLRDRALTGLAAALRDRAGEPSRSAAVRSLFGTSGVWDAALVRDAEVALRRLPAEPQPERQPRRLLIHRRQVTAACAAAQTGELYVGFASGAVARYDSRDSEVTHLSPREEGRVLALAADARGRWLVAVRQAGFEEYDLSSYDLSTSPPTRCERHGLSGKVVPRLTPIGAGNGRAFVGVWQGDELVIRAVADFQTVARLPAPAFLAALLEEGGPALNAAVVVEDSGVWWGSWGPARKRTWTEPLPWAARLPPQPGLPVLSWLALPGGRYEVAGLTPSGGIGWAALGPFDADRHITGSAQVSTLPFRAAALLAPGRLVGVAEHNVCWVRVGEGRPRQSVHRVEVGEVAACFHSPQTNELLLLGPTGDLLQLPVTE